MLTDFFLMRVRQLRQFLAAGLLLILGLTGSTVSAAEVAREWLSPLQQEHPLTGLIVDTVSGQAISYSQLSERLSRSRFILIGEKHDNPDHHRLELRLLQDLIRRGGYDVVLEMLDDQQTDALKQLHASQESGSEAIQQQLDWGSQGWSWADYGEIIRLSLSRADRLRSGNISRPLMMDIYRNADHPLLMTARFQTMGAIKAQQTDLIRKLVFDSHCETLPMEHTGPMARIQIARDASMAHAMQQSPQSAILIAGAFHIRNDFGVPAHLRAAGMVSVSTLRLAETDADKTDWTGYLNPGEKPDFIWFTPRFSDRDYCDDLNNRSGEE